MHPASYTRCMMLILLKCFVLSEKHFINIRSWPFLSSNSLNIDVTLYSKNSTHLMRSQWVIHLALSRGKFTSKAHVSYTQVMWVAFLFEIQACNMVNNTTSKECNKFCFQKAFAKHFTFANLEELKGVPLVY